MKIAAVVVTYNRLNLLKECINAVRNQTRKVDEIIVVNNSSTDGTLEWLNRQKDLTIITQENNGSAGGQYTGIRTAYEKGYDWIWCMDDDGKPLLDTLEKLVKYINSDDIILHPLVLDGEYNNFSFGCWLYPNTSKTILLKTYKEFKELIQKNDELIPSYGTPFNGTLISRNSIQKAGLPNPKYFIWGDESEYILRMVSKGIKSFIVPNSVFLHPYNPLIYDTLSFEKKDWWKLYYKFRNKREILYYFNSNKLLATMKFIKQNLFILINILRNRENHILFKLSIIIIATIHALFNKYGKYNKLNKLIGL